MYGNHTKDSGKKLGGLHECPYEMERARTLGVSEFLSAHCLIVVKCVLLGAHEVIQDRYKRICNVLCSEHCLNLNVMALQEVINDHPWYWIVMIVMIGLLST